MRVENIEKAPPEAEVSEPVVQPQKKANKAQPMNCATDWSGRNDQPATINQQEKLGLVIDLDTCVGCHACVINCKEWNTSGYGTALSDQDPYGANPTGAWLNRIHTFEVVPDKPKGQGVGEVIGTAGEARVVHFPKSCLHCEDAPCVTVCPTGASYKRSEDGIVLVDEDKCIGCGLCAWSCAYGAREMDLAAGVMKKCTLCVDRIYNGGTAGS